MSKAQEVANARNGGIAYALKIVEEKGIEALREEVEFRGATGISEDVSRGERKENNIKMAKHATQLSIAIGINVLVDEYGFGKSQCQHFKEKFDNYVVKCLDETTSVEEQAKIITRAELQGVELLKEF